MAGHIVSMSNYPGSSNSALQAWGGAISGGLGQVLGSGNKVASNITWNSITLPGTTNTLLGYEVWKLDDPGHASSPPVYMKFRFYTGNPSSTMFIYLNVGTGYSSENVTGPGSNVTILLTGPYSAAIGSGSTFTDSSVSNTWMTSDGDGFAWLHAAESTAPGSNSGKFLLVVDRQRNPNGVAQSNTGWPNIGYIVARSFASSNNPTSFANAPLTMVVDPISDDVILQQIRWPIIARPFATSLSGDGQFTLASPMWIVNRQGSYTSKMVLSIPKEDVNAGNIVEIDFLNANRNYKAAAQYANGFDYSLATGSSMALWWGDV